MDSFMVDFPASHVGFLGGYQYQPMVVVVGLGWVVWDSRDTPNNPLSSC